MKLDDFINQFIQEERIPIRIQHLLKSKSFQSIEEFYQYYEHIYLLYCSTLLFPNSFVAFYPTIEERIASKSFSCHLSGALIKKGEEYLSYHPFIENLHTHRVYVTNKDIKACTEFYSMFPQTIGMYEEWYRKLKNSYYEPQDSNTIDFYNLSVECGDTCLDLCPLRSRKK